MSTQDIQFIIHELQVHQVELQLQNEEMRRLQLELETSRDNYSNLYDLAPVCYCTIDRKGIIQEANQMVLEIFGCRKEDLIEKRLAHFIHPDDQDLFYILQRQTLKNQVKQNSEIRIVATDGTIRHVQFQSAASSDQDDQIRVIFSDITKRKEIEQRLRESRENLVHRVRALNALHEAAGSMVSTLDTDTLLMRIINSALKAIPTAKIGVIYLVAASPKPIQISAFALSPDADQKMLTFSNRSRYVSKVLSTRQRLSLTEIKTQDRKSGNKAPEVQKTKSALMVPLIAEDQIYGVVSLESPDEGAFSETEMDLLESFAATATAAIRNARLHEQLQQTAITDFLTKVYNRQGFFEIGQREFQRFLRSTRPLSLIELDIDEFKKINDTYGHAAGDQILITLGQRLMAQLRKVDVLGRYGGDEFVVLLPETNLATALKIAKRLNRTIAEIPIQTGDQLTWITISQGVSQATQDMQDLNNLLKKADDAMYLAKKAGRNQIRSV